MRDNFLVRIQEGDLDVPIDLHQEPAAFPEPSNFEWLIGGQPLRQNGITTTYSSVTFDSIVRTDSGNYTVNATNFLLDNANEPAGNDMGSFCLDVLCKWMCVGKFKLILNCYKLFDISNLPVYMNLGGLSKVLVEKLTSL